MIHTKIHYRRLRFLQSIKNIVQQKLLQLSTNIRNLKLCDCQCCYLSKGANFRLNQDMTEKEQKIVKSGHGSVTASLSIDSKA